MFEFVSPINANVQSGLKKKDVRTINSFVLNRTFMNHSVRGNCVPNNI
jgi:hypothetical protein